MTAGARARYRVPGAALIILSCVAWSFSGVLSKSVSFSPLTLTGLRAAVAALMLAGARGSFRLTPNAGTRLGAVGVTLTSLLFMFANRLTTAANAIVLQYAMPACVILLSFLIYKQRPERADLVAAACVLGGVLLCFAQGLGGGQMLGNVLALLSALTWAMVFFAARMPGTDAMAYTYEGNLLSCLFLLYIPFDGQFAFTWSQLLPAMVMGVCLGLGYLLFSLGMRRGVSPTTAAILSNVEPVFNPTWVFLFAGEKPGLWSVLGAAVVLTSVTVYSIRKGR